MNNMQIIENIEGVHCFLDDNGIVQLNLEDVARGLGFTGISTTSGGKEYEWVRWDRVKKHLVSFEVLTSVEDNAPEYIPEPIFYLLSMKAENETAKAFQRKVAYDILPAIRRTGAYIVEAKPEKKRCAGEAASLVKQLDRIARDKHCTPQERSEIAFSVCGQMGISLPECFIREPAFEQVTFMVRR